MAIDTAIKRGSSINVGLPFGRVLPFPSGVIGVAERQMTAYGYAGIAAGAPPAFKSIWSRRRNKTLGYPVPQPQ